MGEAWIPNHDETALEYCLGYCDDSDEHNERLKRFIEISKQGALVIQASGTGVAPVAVRGSLKVEIQNLIGAEVRVWGSPTDNQPPTPPRAIEVSGYEVVSVGGDTPVVGTLVEEGGAFFLMSGAKVRLGSIPEALRTHIGAKIWVVGTQHDDALSVQSYGIIRH